MEKQFKFKMKLIDILILFCVFLFLENLICSNKSLALYTNDDKANADISTISAGPMFKLTYYGGSTLGSQNPNGKAFTQSDFTKNSKYGWCEYTYNGQKYVVLAAAAYSLFDDSSGPYTWHDYIHYFKVGWKYKNQYDTIQFKFADSNFDSTVYNGIILDECGESMRVGKNDPQILDVYMGTGGESDSANGQKFNQKKVIVTDTGVFTSNASAGGGSNPIASVGIFIRDLVSSRLNYCGDAIQLAINNFGATTTSSQISKLTYSRSEIEADSNLQSQINVQDAQTKEDFKNYSDNKIYNNANVCDTIDDKTGNKISTYTESTPIPVIPADIYSLSIDKIDSLNINFFNASNTNANGFWQKTKSIVSLWTHMFLYLSAALLIGLLIWRSILLVTSTYSGDVVKAVNSRRMMDDWVKSIILVTGVIIIMPIIINLYKNILQFILNGNDSIYLIRVNVENVYQFNTNFTGYVKYMALTSDSLGALGYSALYFIVVLLVDGVWFVVMLIRVIILALLTIISPITAINTMIKKVPSKGIISKNFQSKNWIKTYAFWTFLPLIVIIVHRIMLMIV